MTYDEFKEKVIKEMEELFPNAKVECQTVIKNNDLKLDGLTVIKPEECIHPTIYLNHYYKEDITQEEMVSIVYDIFQIIETNNATFKIQEIINNFKEFDTIKHQITYNLISKELNEDRLKETVYRDFLDMAIIYKVDIDRRSSVTILNKHMEMWDVTEEDIYNAAKENTPKLFPADIEKMHSTINKLIIKDTPGNFEDFKKVFKVVMGIEYEEFVKSLKANIFVVTNRTKHYGASVCLYEGVLEKIANKFSENPLIVMSSVHEFLVVERNQGLERDLINMVNQVNDQEVDEQEVLSYSVYEYDKGSKELKIFQSNPTASENWKNA